ncbi:high-affinity Zn(2+) transporter zrt1 [Entophlyctis luteolus]|nr:high-affinity Zn(2+) transporter zrt1 [Entophlyctis luteolus]
MILHIGGVFVVLLVSGMGTYATFSLGSRKAPILSKILQLCKMFGIGVIAATAWIHLLPDAFSQFASPCLPTHWQSYGTGFVGVFGLLSGFAVQLIEHLASVKSHDAHEHEGQEDNLSVLSHVPTLPIAANDADNCPSAEGIVIVSNTPDPLLSHPEAFKAGGSTKEITTVILELGILFHSMIIGVTLGVTPDDSFTTLLAAICFHQVCFFLFVYGAHYLLFLAWIKMFEGMALGVLLAELDLSHRNKSLLALMYPLTTPVGVVVGILVRNQYNENASGLVLAQGILDSLSAGILFYNTYTELMSTEVSHSSKFYSYSNGFKAASLSAMYAGALAMAIVGYWA